MLDFHFFHTYHHSIAQHVTIQHVVTQTTSKVHEECNQYEIQIAPALQNNQIDTDAIDGQHKHNDSKRRQRPFKYTAIIR